MEDNKIMNEDVMNQVEETSGDRTVDAKKLAIGLGLGTIAGVIIYKKVIKPRFDKAWDAAVARYMEKNQPKCEAEFEECCESEEESNK